MLYSPQALAGEAILVAKALGLSKLSESYLLTEQVVKALKEQSQQAIGILSGNQCEDVSCQTEKAKEAGANVLATIQISQVKSKYKVTIGFYDVESGKLKASKRLSNSSLAGLKEIIPDAAYTVGKKYIEQAKSKESETEDAPKSKEVPAADASDSSEPVAEGDEAVGKGQKHS